MGYSLKSQKQEVRLGASQGTDILKVELNVKTNYFLSKHFAGTSSANLFLASKENINEEDHSSTLIRINRYLHKMDDQASPAHLLASDYRLFLSSIRPLCDYFFVTTE